LKSVKLAKQSKKSSTILGEIAEAEKMAVINGANIAIEKAQKVYQTKVKQVSKTCKTTKDRKERMQILRQEFTLAVKMI
jgi:hypothetical protein